MNCGVALSGELCAIPPLLKSKLDKLLVDKSASSSTSASTTAPASINQSASSSTSKTADGMPPIKKMKSRAKSAD